MPRKADTNLTKIKDFRFDMPALMLADRKKKTVAINVNPETGMFTMRYPDEVQKMLSTDPTAHGRDMHECIRMFERTIEKYANQVKFDNARPVLVVFWRFNKRRPKDGPFNVYRQVGLGGTSFSDAAPDTGLALSYERLYRIGPAIFEVAVNEETGAPEGTPDYRYAGDCKSRLVIDWTAEREAFLDSMIEGMEALIKRCGEFFGAELAANMDRMIAAGFSGLALPAPADVPPP